MIRDYQAIGRTWFPKGQQKQIPTYGKRWGAKLLGTLNYGTGEVLWHHANHHDAAVFLAFLKQVVEHCPGKRIVMILNHARIHQPSSFKDGSRHCGCRRRFTKRVNADPEQTIKRLCWN